MDKERSSLRKTECQAKRSSDKHACKQTRTKTFGVGRVRAESQRKEREREREGGGRERNGDRETERDRERERVREREKERERANEGVVTVWLKHTNYEVNQFQNWSWRQLRKEGKGQGKGKESFSRNGRKSQTPHGKLRIEPNSLCKHQLWSETLVRGQEPVSAGVCPGNRRPLLMQLPGPISGLDVSKFS